ncbi:MAG: BatD family protein [bacterium]|nr:BatD family protein [bacterium]
MATSGKSKLDLENETRRICFDEGFVLGKLNRSLFVALGFFVLMILGARPVCAQVTLEASVDRSQVEVGDMVELTVAIEANQVGGLPSPQVPTPAGLQLAGSTSSSATSIRIVNGAMSTTRTTTYVFSFRAEREGSYVLGPAVLTNDGKTFQSSPVRVEVLKNSGRAQTRPSQGQSMTTDQVREIEENLYLGVEADKESVYVGEQIGITYKLYTRFDVNNVHYGQIPTFTGFWAETVFDAKRLNLQRERVDGKVFNVAELKRMALFPTTQGTHVLEQLEIVCDVPIRSRSRSLFGFDGFDAFDPFRTQQVTVRSEDLSVVVKPLPSGAPAGFAGAVGRFDITAEATPTEVHAGDPVAVKVTVIGAGNLQAVSEPQRPEDTQFRFYDPKAQLETDAGGGKYGGKKTFEYVMIPTKSGSVTLPAFRLAFFDPRAERYDIIESKPILLTVAPNPNVRSPEVLAGREEVRVLGQDIRYIKPDRVHLANQGSLLYQRGSFWVMQVLPLLGVAGAYVYRRHRDRLAGDVAYARRRSARSRARKRMAGAEKLKRDGDSAGFHAEIHRSVAAFLGDRLNRSAAGLTAEAAVADLAQRGATDRQIDLVRQIFQACDLARFAPGQVGSEQMDALYEKAVLLIDDLERMI